MTNVVKTVFTATLVQDSALSVGGVDRQSTADQPLAMIGETPVLSGRGLKGAAVAMARRFFRDLPRSISEDLDREEALVRSAWEFRDAKPKDFKPKDVKLGLRAGVGILHKTGARAQGVLYDREVVEAGARWPLTLCVDWYWARVAEEDPKRIERIERVEGILHYVLAEHWAKGRCWLGGGAARGLGWCHLEDLKTYRLDQEAYDQWRRNEALPSGPSSIESAKPTKNWYFREKTIELCAGEYKLKDKDGTEKIWGLDMLAIGPHSQSVQHQPFDRQHWVLPRWATPNPKLKTIETNRAIAMEGGTPLLPGSSLRGPLRHAASRLRRQAGEDITDPNRRDDNQKSGDQAQDSPRGTSTREDKSIAPADSVAQLFGTVETSSRLLICDGHAKPDAKGDRWLAARMHMHAEDEFSAGSYGSAKREAVRLLRATFPVRLVLEGPDPDAIKKDCAALDKLIALGELGHLPLGGHKTHGAGGGRWVDKTPWIDKGSFTTDSPPCSAPAEHAVAEPQTAPPERKAKRKERKLPLTAPSATLQHSVQTTPLSLDHAIDTLGEAAEVARKHLGEHLTCWWCEPKINLDQDSFDPFGTSWDSMDSQERIRSSVLIDEAIFYSEDASIRFARTRAGMKAVLLRLEEEASTPIDTAACPRAFHAWRHDEHWRFPSLAGKTGTFLFREWRNGEVILGHTATLVPTTTTSEAK